MKRILLLGALLLVASFVLAGLLAARKSEGSWFSAVTNTNGYDALVRAEAQMNGEVPGEKADAAAFVKENGPMFEMVTAALKLPFEVPPAMYSLTNSLPMDFSRFKHIALALRARGKEAEQRGAKAEAVTNYISIIELGQRVEHGPVIALLVGVALEKMGLDALERAAPDLVPAERNDVAARLDSLNRTRLPYSEVLLREEYFARQVAGNPVKLLIGRLYIRPALGKAEQKQEKISGDFQRVAKELRARSEEQLKPK